MLRLPAQFLLDLCCIDRIPNVIALPVFHIGDQRLKLAKGRLGRIGVMLEDGMDDVDVVMLGFAADIVDFSGLPLF